jgi:hypothetical protein
MERTRLSDKYLCKVGIDAPVPVFVSVCQGGKL